MYALRVKNVEKASNNAEFSVVKRCDSCLFCQAVQKGSPYSITERRFQALIEVLGSQPAGDVNHKLDGRLLLGLLSARTAVTPSTLKRAVKMLRRPFIFWLYSCKIWLLTLIDSPICTWWLVELYITKTGNQPITRGRFF